MGTVGGDHHADHTAVGDTANVAARLQALAEPGEILVSDATARLVGAYARLEPVGALALKGKSAAVAAHRLFGVGPRRSPLDGVTERSSRRSWVATPSSRSCWRFSPRPARVMARP